MGVSTDLERTYVFASRVKAKYATRQLFENGETDLLVMVWSGGADGRDISVNVSNIKNLDFVERVLSVDGEKSENTRRMLEGRAGSCMELYRGVFAVKIPSWRWSQ